MEITAVAGAGQRVGERDFLQFEILAQQFGAALGDGSLQLPAACINGARAQADEKPYVDGKKDEGRKISPPGLPPGRLYLKGEDCGAAAPRRIAHAALHQELIVAWRQRWVARFSQHGCRELALQACELIAALGFVRAAQRQRGKFRGEGSVLVLHRVLRMARPIVIAHHDRSERHSRRFGINSLVARNVVR